MKSILKLLMAAALCLVCAGVALAEGPTLPAGLKTIEDEAFSGAGFNGTLVIPDGVTRIGRRAFEDNYLSIVHLPASLVEIADDAFWSGTKFAVDLDSYAFDWCVANRLTWKIEPNYDFSDFVYDEFDALVGYVGDGGDVVVPPCTPEGYPTYVEDTAFQYNTSITGITLMNGIRGIRYDAFRGCDNLQSITLPASITEYHLNYGDCPKLMSINIDAANPNYSSVDGVLFDKAGTTLIEFPAGRAGSYSVPEGVTEIGECAFYKCAALTEVTLPDSVKTVGNSAFSGCGALARVDLGGLEGGIGDHVFADCEALTEIDIPEGVTSIGYCSFSSCTRLRRIGLPAGLRSIGDQAFISCSALEALDLPDGVETLGEGILYGNYVIETITIPRSVMEMTEALYATSIRFVYLYRDTVAEQYCLDHGLQFEYLTDYGDYEFDGGVLLRYTGTGGLVKIPEADGEGNPVTAIGDGAFSGCAGVDAVYVPAGVTSIGANAFAGCTKVSNIILPAGVTQIGDGAFSGCDGLMLFVHSGSEALDWCAANGQDYHTIDVGLDYYEGKLTIYHDEFNGVVYTNCTERAVIPAWDEDGNRIRAVYGLNQYYGDVFDEYILSEGIERFEGGGLYTSNEEKGFTRRVWLPASLENIDYIGQVIFAQSFEVAPGNPAYVAVDGVLYTRDMTRIAMLPRGRTGVFEVPAGIDRLEGFIVTDFSGVIIPESVQVIESGCFERMLNLKQISLPSSLTYIGNRAFYACPALESVDFADSSSTLEMYSGVFEECGALKRVHLPEGLTGIGDDTFLRCNLEEVNIPSTVSSIGKQAFEHQPVSITSIPENVTSIGDRAFWGSGDRFVFVTDKLIEIGDDAFNWNITLHGVSGSVAQAWAQQSGNDFVCMDYYTFSDDGSAVTRYTGHEADALMPLVNPAGEAYTHVGEGCFEGCQDVISVRLPDSITSIGVCAFYNCASLRRCAIPYNLTEIRNAAFGNCARLRTLSLSRNVTYIHPNAFDGGAKLTLIGTYTGFYEDKQYLQQWCEDNGMPYAEAGGFGLNGDTYQGINYEPDVYYHRIVVPDFTFEGTAVRYIESGAFYEQKFATVI